MQYLAATDKVIAAYGNNISKGFISIIESECKEQDIQRANPPKLSFLRNQINDTEMCAIFDPLAMDPSILDKEMVFSKMIEDIKTKISNFPGCFLRFKEMEVDDDDVTDFFILSQFLQARKIKRDSYAKYSLKLQEQVNIDKLYIDSINNLSHSSSSSSSSSTSDYK